MPESRPSHLSAVFALAAIAFIWAGGFPATKYCINSGLSVGALLSIRFAIGTAGLGLMLVLSTDDPDQPELTVRVVTLLK